MSTLDEITQEKQRVSEALARIDAQREKLAGQPASPLSDAPSWIPDIRFTAGVGRKLSGCFLRD